MLLEYKFKLSISGEKTEDALIPAVLKSMNEVENSFLYNKFVVRDKECLQEVDMFVEVIHTGKRVRQSSVLNAEGYI